MNPAKKGTKRSLTEVNKDEPRKVKAKVVPEPSKKRSSSNQICRTYSRSNKTLKQSKDGNAATSPPFSPSSLLLLFETISIQPEVRVCKRLEYQPKINFKQLHDERIKRQRKK